MRKHIIITAVSCLAIGALCGFVFKPFGAAEDIQIQYYKYANVLQYLSQNAVDTVNISKVTETAIKSALETLNDPYSEYMPPKQKEAFEEAFRGNFQGVGIRFGIYKDTITVTCPLIGGPSEAAGIQFNDKIVKIDGISAIGIKQDSVPLKLKGPAGTQVTVTIKRVGNPDLIDLKITRGVVPTSSVEGAYMLDNSDIGYVYINKFAATTTDDVIRAVQKLKKEGMKKLVLDLRYNPGGYMTEAYRLADEFLKGGHRIVYTKDRNDQIREQYYSRDGNSLEDIPVVVMINGGSASASEIVSGALQDLDRGLIVGETSFGKGLVQQIFPLNDGSGVKFTTARYYTPSGRLIQRPYKDKKQYLAMEGRADLKEGANLDHTGESDSTRPSFKTLGGRKVLGGGGIVPDYVIKSDTSIAKFYDSLARKGVFWEAAEKFVLMQGQTIRTKYNKDLKTYLNNYTVGNEYLTVFKDIVKEKKLEWKEVEFKADEKFITNSMKYMLAYYMWSWSDGSFIGALMQPAQLEKAIKLFPEAAKIAKAK